MNTHTLVDTFLRGLLGQYEEKTGLKGIGEIGHGLLSNELKQHIPNSPVNPTFMELGAKVIDWVNNFKSEGIQTSESVKPPTAPLSLPDQNVGQTHFGYSGFKGRTGRMR